MKRLIILLSVFLLLSFSAYAAETVYYPDENGSYTIEYNTGKANQEYILTIIAGDYTDKDAPSITQDNIIYINNTVSDDSGVVNFSGFVPLTESVGTVYLCSTEESGNAGLLMTEQGFGFIAGKLISYSGDKEKVLIPKTFTEISDGAFDKAENTTAVIVISEAFSAIKSSFRQNTLLLLSPLAEQAISFAKENGFTYGVLGDYNRDEAVNAEDMTGILGHFARESEAPYENFTDLLDLDLDGRVTLNDASVLLSFLGGKIADFFS